MLRSGIDRLLKIGQILDLANRNELFESRFDQTSGATTHPRLGGCHVRVMRAIAGNPIGSRPALRIRLAVARISECRKASWNALKDHRCVCI